MAMLAESRGGGGGRGGAVIAGGGGGGGNTGGGGNGGGVLLTSSASAEEKDAEKMLCPDDQPNLSDLYVQKKALDMLCGEGREMTNISCGENSAGEGKTECEQNPDHKCVSAPGRAAKNGKTCCPTIGNNPTPNNEWVRFNVGGKIFQTTNSTLSTHPESFLARLANGNISTEKDESGAFLVDRSSEHFDTILNYFRNNVVNLDRNEKAMKDLLSEANFYNVQSLVDEIHKAMVPANIRFEVIMIFVHHDFDNKDVLCRIYCSEKHNDYEVLRALRNKFNAIEGEDGLYQFAILDKPAAIRIEIEAILLNFGFDEKFYDANHMKSNGYQQRHWKFVRNVSK